MPSDVMLLTWLVGGKAVLELLLLLLQVLELGSDLELEMLAPSLSLSKSSS